MDNQFMISKSASVFQKNKSVVLMFALLVIVVLSGIQCKSKRLAQSSAQQSVNTKKGLKDYYKKYFPIGVAVNMAALKGADSALIVNEFNSITPENDMKMGPIHPQENVYNWKNADAIVAFAVKHHIKIRGHNLLWHNQAPGWMFKNADGSQVSKELLLKRLKDHITTVVNRYKGKIYVWDVVNEAIDDDSTKFMRNSLWYKICGDDFIPKAFEYAHAADPKAELYYNDYNSEHPAKREHIYQLLKSLVDAKVPITGVGMQAHWKLNDPSPELLRKAINQCASLGLKIQITELDITIRTFRPRPRPAADGTTAAAIVPPAPDPGFTPELEQKQMAQYKMVFDVFREYKNVITSVTFWNLSDRYSWLDSRGGGLAGGAAAGAGTERTIRKAYPLLFDENLQRKKAYWSVVNF